ncbi:FAD-dependent oxidoreductase [Oleomonas cavernae]|uniref:FAD-dependent oxidoreductase n=1 Tax=Oleomonas cavernae TaxID=2320859 RepID=A0A418WCA9_9PROT|nr:FAD-dependent oxidoreductase [Oleomonas cavernae]RJF87596.1 FAD-dependent oxidoreductase [Oleomonas cavernae]
MAAQDRNNGGIEGLFDVAVVGGGVVGCAIAREFTLAGARTILLEQGPDILSGASKANSAILHTGFDAPVGSLEQRLVAESHALYCKLHDRLNLPLLETGALLVAWSEAEEARLPEIIADAHRNGVGDVEPVTAAQARARVPALGPLARAGVVIPREYVIDPWTAPLAYLSQAVRNGAVALFRAAVESGDFDGSAWHLTTPRGTVHAAHVINAAGLHGDQLDQALLGASAFTIRPRKGQFVVFDKAAARLVDTILLPVPTTRTKGVVVCPTIFGNVLVGPTAEEQDSRTDTSVKQATLEALKAEAARLVPALAQVPVTAVYAGLRPASEEKDYRILATPARHWITVGGIRSTGLTGALGIARHVLGLYGNRHAPLPDPAWQQMPNLAEYRPRDWSSPGHGEIVCHCELVTRREIEAALLGDLPAADLAGVKRRTRAMMGRCQGFYCAARISELVDGAIDPPFAVGPAHG